MPTDTKLKELIINELTEEQYKALTPNDDELYLTPDGSITKNENGSYVLDGDVDITGTTKLKGGLTPISIKNGDYQTLDGDVIPYSVLDFGEFKDTGNRILGLTINGEYELIGVGYYNISGTASDNFDIYGISMVNGDFERIRLDDSEPGTEPIYQSLAFTEYTQPKLYRHKLTVNNLFVLMYNSTSNLKVNSVDNLRTIMKISTTKQEILPVCASDATSMATLIVTTSLCQVDGVDVTAVSDVVEEL